MQACNIHDCEEDNQIGCSQSQWRGGGGESEVSPLAYNIIGTQERGGEDLMIGQLSAVVGVLGSQS